MDYLKLLILSCLVMVLAQNTTYRDRYGNTTGTRERSGNEYTYRDQYGNTSMTEEKRGDTSIYRDRFGNTLGTERRGR